jgi:hypothetical protein
VGVQCYVQRVFVRVCECVLCVRACVCHHEGVCTRDVTAMDVCRLNHLCVCALLRIGALTLCLVVAVKLQRAHMGARVGCVVRMCMCVHERGVMFRSWVHGQARCDVRNPGAWPGVILPL